MIQLILQYTKCENILFMNNLSYQASGFYKVTLLHDVRHFMFNVEKSASVFCI